MPLPPEDCSLHRGLSMTITRVLPAAILLLAAITCPTAASAQSRSSSCADCHYANPTAPEPDHLSDWEHGSHGGHKVGCESCHGGDASTFEQLLSHRGILHSSHPDSPVNRRNLPATCGKCHAGPFVRFQKSRHFELLRAGDGQVPTCTACHDSVGTDRPSPRLLEAACNRCHGPKGVAPRMERAAAARTLLEEVQESRDLLQSIKPLIDRTRDKTRQEQRREAYRQAEVPLIEAGRSVHEFVFDNLKERLVTARRRIEALLVDLANP
jgi:Cytochrome c7 and related cytochrome c/Cytochrome c554 and c-prime